MLRAFRRKQVKKEVDKVVNETKKDNGETATHKCRTCHWKQADPFTCRLSERGQKACLDSVYYFSDEPVAVCNICHLVYEVQRGKCLLCNEHIRESKDAHVRGRRAFCKSCAHHYDQQLAATD